MSAPLVPRRPAQRAQARADPARPAAPVRTADWQARADHLLRQMVESGHDPHDARRDLQAALGDITFHDEHRRAWRHDGQAWKWWDGAAWAPATPPALLTLTAVDFEVEPEVDDAPAPLQLPGVSEPGPAAGAPPTAPAPATAYRPTHRVPAGGMAAWVQPHPATPPHARLDAGLDVQLLERRPEGWARIRCSNGWEAWVDGRLLGPP